MRAITATAVLLAAVAGTLRAQAVPEESQGARVDLGYRRTPSLRVDPFRHVMIPHFGFVFSVGARGANNVLNMRDVGALILLDSDDEVGAGDTIDALGLVPQGGGVRGSGQGEGGLYLGGPIAGGVSIGLSVQGRGYGSFEIDDDAVALLRDGNATRQEFSLGDSRGSGLAAAEYGVHAVLRLGPYYSVDGPHITLGAGARLVRPVAFGRGLSEIDGGGRVLIAPDSIDANIAVESFHTPIETGSEVTDAAFAGDRGSGIAADFLVRVSWPTNGLALEAMVANLGSVTIDRVERRIYSVAVSTTRLDSVITALDSASFDVQDTVSLDVTLPRIVRFGASAWANRILQLDLSATLAVGGAFPAPAAVDVGSTWRFIRTIPLRAGLILGDNQGVGFSGGIAIEGGTMFLQIAGQSLGGLFNKATGVAGRFELGLFF